MSINDRDYWHRFCLQRDQLSRNHPHHCIMPMNVRDYWHRRKLQPTPAYLQVLQPQAQQAKLDQEARQAYQAILADQSQQDDSNQLASINQALQKLRTRRQQVQKRNEDLEGKCKN